VLTLASLSTSLGATACRGSGAHNICAGHGSCARLLAAAGARQPSKKLAQVVIGDERAASELARHEVSVADCGVHGISAEAGQRAVSAMLCARRPVSVMFCAMCVVLWWPSG